MPTRLAIFSDVHGDLHALDLALASARKLGCTRFLCAGDVVDFGLFPDEVIARLRELDIPTVRGNHDRWAVTGQGEAGGSSWAADLSSDSKRWLRELPERWTGTIGGVRVLMTHARPGSDMHGIDAEGITADEVRPMFAKAGADVVVVGHTHEPFELVLPAWGSVVNPAAVLRDPAPGAENPPATGTFGVLELPTRRFTVHRVGDGAEVEIRRRKL